MIEGGKRCLSELGGCLSVVQRGVIAALGCDTGQDASTREDVWSSIILDRRGS